SALFIVAVWHPTTGGGVDSILRFLRNLGCQNSITFVPLFWRYPDSFTPYYLWDLPSRLIAAAHNVRSAFALFADAESQAEYVRQVRFRLTGDFGCLNYPASHAQYFPDRF